MLSMKDSHRMQWDADVALLNTVSKSANLPGLVMLCVRVGISKLPGRADEQ